MIFKQFGKSDWGLVITAGVLIWFQVWLDLKIPDYMSSITKTITQSGTMDAVLSDGIMMIACALGSLVLAIITTIIAGWVSASVSARIRDAQYSKVSSFSSEEINRFSAASLITRSTNDVTQIQISLAIGMQVLMRAPMTAVIALGKISSKNLEWTTATGVAIVSLLLVMGILMSMVIPRFKKIQWLTDNVNRTARENLTGVKVVRAYNAERLQSERFEEANGELTGTTLFTSRSMSVMMPSMMLVMNILSLSIYWIGAFLISATGNLMGRITLFSDMVVFMSYAMQVVMAFLMLVMVMFILPRAMVASKRIGEILDTKVSIVGGNVQESPAGKEGEISFRNVYFKYPEAADYVLKDISFDLKKGETAAFIGSTGSGKSTLVDLIPRFHDASEGEILVDGVNIKDYDLEALRSKIGYVPQKAVLFSGTVKSNVAFGDTVHTSEEDVAEAVRIAQAEEFVEKLDGEYSGRIAQSGTNLSGGQKQRISIARAVCRKPEFYIFDDSFSALDYKTDRVLRSALKKKTGGVTSIMVAQRIGTVKDADKIIVLDGGRVVGMGKHSELLKNCPTYLEIARSQLTEEELMA